MSQKKNQQNTSNEKELKLEFHVRDIKKYWNNQTPPDLKSLKDGKFTDPLFLPNKNSLMGLNQKTGKPIDQQQYDQDAHEIHQDKIIWKRAPEIFLNCLLFEDKIIPGDIMQGSLGNCYFLSAIAAITEYPNLIHEIFKTNRINEYGIYEIALFLDGEWQIVIIDDYLPYDIEFENSAFTQANGQEIWVLMIEKAWAKVNGGYLNIIGGLSDDPLLALTGMHTRKVDTSIDVDLLWNTLKYSDKNGFIMCINSNAKGGKERNLVESHAYTLIGVQEEKYKNKLIRLCQVRNPWGNKEWNGDWSDNSPLWDDYLKQKFKFKNFKDDEWNDGVFFISIEDIQKYFSIIYICAYMYGSNTRTLEIKKENFNEPSIFGFYLNEDNIDCSISTHGQNWRYNRHLKDKDIPMSLVLAKVDVNNNNELTYFDSHFGADESPFIIEMIPKGFYIISVYYGPNDDNKRYLNDFNLKVSANTNFRLDFLTYDKDFKILTKILTNLVLNEKSEEIKSEDLYMCAESEIKTSGFGYLLWSNNTKGNYLKSTSDWSEMLGYKMLPPLDNKENTTIFCNPGDQKLILGMKTRDKGEFWFNVNVNSSKKKSPFSDNKNSEQNLNKFNSDLLFNNINVEGEEIANGYYQFISPSITEAGKCPVFESLDLYEFSKVNMEKKYPEKMKQVLELDNSKIDYLKNQGNVLWKKIPATNGFYLCEYHEKQGIFGRVIFTFEDNSYFKGIYIKNVREGYFEEFSDKNEMVFKGNYSKGKRNGFGVAYFEDGSYYEGNFIDNVKVGQGKYYFPKGAYYIGDFKNNLINGRGKYFFKENEYWEGNFVDNKKEGEGIYYFASGKTKIVSFKDNKLVKK